MRKQFIKLTLVDGRKHVYLNIENIVSVEAVDGGSMVTTNTTASINREVKVTENAEGIIMKCEGRS